MGKTIPTLKEWKEYSTGKRWTVIAGLLVLAITVISLFSDKEKTHDRITRCKGSFGKTIKGIDNLLEGS